MNRSLAEKMYAEGEGWATGRGVGCGACMLQEGPGLCRSPGDAHGFIKGPQLDLRGWG